MTSTWLEQVAYNGKGRANFVLGTLTDAAIETADVILMSDAPLKMVEKV